MSAKPFIMFLKGEGVAAIEWYQKEWNAKIHQLKKNADGKVEMAELTVFDLTLKVIDSSGHAYEMNPAISFFVEFNSKEELNSFYKKIPLQSAEEVAASLKGIDPSKVLPKSAEGFGIERVPLGEYPFSPYFGWIEDQFGVNWQMSLKLSNEEEKK